MNKIQQIATLLKEKGIDCYYAGGCVRDELMGLPAGDDIDICLVGVINTENVEDILIQFSDHFVKEVGNSFPVWLVSIDGVKYDFALARTEKKVGESRLDFLCNIAGVTIEEDLKRRDLTINSIAKNVLTDEIIDPYNGREDIKMKRAHPTSEAFGEDTLRVLRAARFIARFDLHPTTDMLVTCIKLSPTDISPERVGMELMKVFKQADKPSKFFRFLYEVGWLGYYFSELVWVVAVEQNPIYHPEGDVFEHTMYCLDQTKKGDWFTRAVMLCHDLGKASCTIFEDGRWKSPGHEAASVPLTNAMLKRVHFTDHKTINQIKTLVKLHMIATLPEISDKVVKKHLRELMSFDLTYDQLVEVCRCDKSGRPPLPPVTPNIGQDRAKQFIHDGVMIPIVTGELLQRHGFINNIEWGRIIKACLDFQDRGSLNINNWRKVMQDAGMLKLITPIN